MLLAMVARNVWIFFLSMALLCKFDHPFLCKSDAFNISLTVSNVLQHAPEHGWEDTHRRCQAQQPGRGSQVTREGCLPLIVMALVDRHGESWIPI